LETRAQELGALAVHIEVRGEGGEAGEAEERGMIEGGGRRRTALRSKGMGTRSAGLNPEP